MTHLTDGVIRRMQDEPASTNAADAAHFAECARCQMRADDIRAASGKVERLLSVADGPVEPEVALLRLRRRAAEHPGAGVVQGGRLARLRRRAAWRPIVAGALALGLMGGLVATGVADNFVQQFEPKTFVAVNVNPDSLGSLPDLSQFGAYKLTEQPKFTPAQSADAALANSGLGALLQPSIALPATVKGQPQWVSFSQLQGSFTFSADKAREYAASKGKPLPAMPAGVDGTTVSLVAGPGVLTVYGAPSATAAGTDAAPAGTRRGLEIPSLAIVQMTTPKVTSDGASVQVLEGYLASLPGIPPDLAAQIQAIGDPATTLPIPVPTGQGSHEVDVNGSKGLFVGDSTGLGAGVIWQRDGVLYAVVGTLSESDVVNVARGLR